MLKNMNKTTKNNMITYLMVIVVYAVIQVLVTSGSLSSLFTGLLVPICTYIILAISLNLVVGFLGELSLGHAGFMCIGAFTSAFFSKCMKGVIDRRVRYSHSAWPINLLLQRSVPGSAFYLAALFSAAGLYIFAFYPSRHYFKQ